jgi:DNA-binding CsgD family transcriptional regulator
MTLAAIHHMMKDRFETPLSRPELVRLHEAAGGNPLFALEIAGAGRPGGPGRVGLAVPERLRELVADRIPRLSAEAREALLAAATLSHPTAELVERVSSADALSAAEESGLIRVVDGGVDFVHPLYSSVIYETASTARRRELHRRLAAKISEPEERARHLASAATEPSEEVALALEDAAELARARGAWDAAGELMETSARLTPADLAGARDRRLLSAAEHQIHAGGRSRARRTLEEILADERPPAVRAEALRLLGEITWQDDDFAGAIATLAEALECAEEPRLLASIELALGWLQPTFSDYSGGGPITQRALRHAEQAGDRALIAGALALGAELGFLSGNGVDWEAVERSLELEDHEAIVPMMWRPSMIGALLELWVGRIADAREHLNAVLATTSERGDESDLSYVLLWLSWLEVKNGNFATARELAEQMETAAVLGGSNGLQAYALGQQALVHAHRGEVDEARASAEQAAKLNEANPQPQVILWTGAALGLLELSLGNAEAAWRACEPVAEGFEAQGIAEPVVTHCLPEALEAMIVLGQLDRAEALLDGFEGRARELDRAWALATGGRCRGLLLAARGDLVGAADALTASLAEHERIEMPLETGRTLLVKGQVERRARRRARAKETLGRALEIFEALGSPRWAERAREEIARLGMRRSDPDRLTEAERRVAEAAARGMTNREVAATLFLSPKTVEAHLSSVYRKLEISSRAELGARMAPDPQN